MEHLSPNAELVLIQYRELLKQGPNAVEDWILRLVVEHDRAIAFANQVARSGARKSAELPPFHQRLNVEADRNKDF